MWKHPELKDGEEFLYNVKILEEFTTPDFCVSHRLGIIAYYAGGGIVDGYKPVFIVRKSIDPTNINRVLIGVGINNEEINDVKESLSNWLSSIEDKWKKECSNDTIFNYIKKYLWEEGK